MRRNFTPIRLQYKRYYQRLRPSADNEGVTEYRVVFANATPSSINIKADKVNLGIKKLWFYDAENRLIAVYQWDHLIGFDIVGSAAEQNFTDALLHEKRPLSTPERAEAIEQRGMLMVLLEEALATLERAKDDIRGQWCKINDENKNKTQVALLIQRQEARIRQLQAGLIDGNSELQKVLGLLQMEFRDMGLPAPPMTSSSTPPSLLTTESESQDKKRKWFS